MTQQQPAPPASGVEVHRWPVSVGRDRHPPGADVLSWWRQRPPVLRPLATSPVAAAGVVAAAVAAAEAGSWLLHQALRSLPTARRRPNTAAVDHGSSRVGEPAR